MDVIKSNFEETFPLLSAALQDADFIAVDTELTGLTASGPDRPKPFESQEHYYRRVRESARNFGVLQYGVCPFRWNSETKEFVAYPFNFNIFPSAYGGADQVFYVQTSSLTFLASNKFDFNKPIHNGVPFLSRGAEQRLREKGAPFVSGRKPSANTSDIVISQERDRLFVDRIKQQTAAWLAGDKSHEPLDLEPCNSFLRRLVHQETAKAFPDVVTEAVDSRFVRLTQMTQEERERRQQDLVRKAEGDFAAAVGFRRVIDLIAESGLPVVGHNAFLDFVHTLDKFVKAAPDSEAEFKAEFHILFPHIFDTKLIASRSKDLQTVITETALGDAFKKASSAEFQSPKVAFAANFDRYRDETYAHEASYDAYMTGVLFLRMLYKIASASGVSADGFVSSRDPCLAEFRDRLYMMASDADYRLDGPHETPSRAHVLYVSGFSADTKTSDLFQFFSKFGRVRVQWLDQTSAFVCFDDARVIEENASAMRDGPFTWCTFEDYADQQKAGGRKRPLETESGGEMDEHRRSKKSKQDQWNCAIM